MAYNLGRAVVNLVGRLAPATAVGHGPTQAFGPAGQIRKLACADVGGKITWLPVGPEPIIADSVPSTA